MKRYERYKDSGIEWIGEIPAHWIKVRLKVCINKSVNGVWGEDKKNDDNDLICVRVANFHMQTLGISTDNLTIRNIQRKQQNGRVLSKNDLLIEKSGGGELQPVGRVVKFDLKEKSVCSNFISKMDVKFQYIDSNYLVYLFYAMYNNRLNTKYIKQTTGIQNLDLEGFLGESIYLPNMHEQSSIVIYLNHKTAEIDQLIAKKQQLIELLREEKTALINQAVTKGLNPDAPMKDSGIEWLGEVPGHWEVKLLKYVSPEITVGIVITPSKYYVPNGVPCLRSLNIKMMRIDENELVYISQESNQALKKSMLFEGDLVAVRTGQTGTTAVVDKRFHETNCIDLIIIRKSIKYNSNFMAYQLNSSFAKAQFDKGSGGTIQQHFNIETAKNLIIVTPPVNEQEKISQYLEAKISEIDTIVKRENKSINLLHEYRTALISEAVTGKIDVRQWAMNRAGGTVAG